MLEKWLFRPQKMLFLFADEFLNMLLVYRSLWIQGRYGGGKTSLAIILAAWLYNQNHVTRIITNTHSVLDTPLKGSEGKPEELLYDCALVVDEAHAFMSDRASVSQYAKFLRKTNYYLLMPSVLPPHIRLTSFAVQRIFNGMIYAMPLWVYRWNLRQGNIREKGTFGIWYPQAVWGAYDTKSIPIDDAGISDAIDLTIKYEQGKHKQGIIVDEPCLEWQNKFLAARAAKNKMERELFPEGIGHAKKAESPVSQTHNPDAENALEDAAEEISEASNKIADAAKGLQRKIRRV